MHRITVNPARRSFPRFLHDVVDAGHIQIHDPPAFCTDKMIVGLSPGVKAVGPLRRGDLGDLADTHQQGQIPIHSPQTDIRVDLPHTLINHISSRMVFPGLQQLFDRFSLAAIFQCPHAALLLRNCL